MVFSVKIWFCSMIQVTDTISIDEREIQEEFVRASGPGGQNVNKVATAVQLRFDVMRSSLPADVRARVRKLAGRRVNSDGVLIIQAQRYRAQEQNRDDARTRLFALIRQAAIAPARRRRSRPTAASKERRLSAKKRRAERKRTRGAVRTID